MSLVPPQLSRALWLQGLVRERGRFVLREATRRPGVHRYRLRDIDAVAHVRHGGTDVFVLHEAVRDAFYAPPEPVRALLGARGPALRVLDLGGNLGFFGLRTLALYPQAVITAYEPDTENAAILRRTIAANDRAGAWEVVEEAASNADGEMRFAAGEGALSREPEDEAAATTTVPMRDVMPLLGEADLVKIDIEGGEWALLGDERFGTARPPAVLLEWHSYHCPGDNPRRVAREMLEAHDYTVLHEKPAPVPDSEPLYGAGTLWAWQEAR